MDERMFKVMCPVEKKDGRHVLDALWQRVPNKDDSINVYLDATAARSKPAGVKLQLRELTEEELRERAEKRSTYAARGSLETFTRAASATPRHADARPVLRIACDDEP